MKLLRKLPSEGIEGLFFEICLNSIGEYVTTEFKLDYEITEVEFKKFNKWLVLYIAQENLTPNTLTT